MISGFTCLLQISTRREDFIVDPFPLMDDLWILNEVFTDPSIIKVTLFLSEDVLLTCRFFMVQIWIFCGYRETWVSILLTCLTLVRYIIVTHLSRCFDYHLSLSPSVSHLSLIRKGCSDVGIPVQRFSLPPQTLLRVLLLLHTGFSDEFSVTAAKEYQLADWRIRPLPAELLKYAREDTHYLLYIYDR